MTKHELETKLAELEKKMSNLKIAIAEVGEKEEPKFERRRGEGYYHVVFSEGFTKVFYETDIGGRADFSYFKNNNYFHTKERAQGVADKINFLLRLERLHDTFCPDYVPDWYNFEAEKWYVFNNSTGGYEGGYDMGSVSGVQNKTNVYFPSEKIAQKVCDILNAEMDGDSE